MKRILLTLVTLIAGCGNGGSTLPAEAWGTAEYVAAGVPDPSGPWSAAERTRAADVIRRAAVDHRERLPRFHGDKSDLVLARLLDQPQPDPPEMAFPVRLDEHLRRYQELDALAALYGSAPGGPAPREVVEILDADYRDAVVAFELMADEGFRRRVDELLVEGIHVAADARVADADRVAMSGGLLEALHQLADRLPPARRRGVRAELTQAAEATSGVLRDRLVAAARELPPP